MELFINYLYSYVERERERDFYMKIYEDIVKNKKIPVGNEKSVLFIFPVNKINSNNLIRFIIVLWTSFQV